MSDFPGFHHPNHTQVPNDLFDVHLREMGLAELKVVLVVLRETLGWQRNRASLTLDELAELSGLDRGSVLDGAGRAERRGVLRRSPEARKGTTWEVRWTHALLSGGFTPPQGEEVSAPGGVTPPGLVVLHPQTGGATPPPVGHGKKERKKESEKKEDSARPSGLAPVSAHDQTLYVQALALLSRTLPKAEFVTWVQPTSVAEQALDGDVLRVVLAPANGYAAAAVRRHIPAIEAALKEVSGRPTAVTIAEVQ
jgi:hypothetical protein